MRRRPDGQSGGGPFRRDGLGYPEGPPRGFMSSDQRLHEPSPRLWDHAEQQQLLGGYDAGRERAERQRHADKERVRCCGPGGSVMPGAAGVTVHVVRKIRSEGLLWSMVDHMGFGAGQ